MFLLNTLATTATTDTRDVGFISKVGNGTALTYTGLFRDSVDSTYKLFQGLQTAPNVTTGVIANATDIGFSYASLNVLNFHAFGNTQIEGNLTVNGAVSTFNVNTLTVQDNIIVANSGPLSMKPDGGFVLRRTAAGIALDTPKQTGTASAAGSTTTITLQANNGHGTTQDYYKGWTIKTAGDVTGTAVVSGSSSSNPPVLTVATALSGATSILTTYQLFNKGILGTIYSESAQQVTFVGFPREDLVGTISLTGNNGDGNLADYVTIKARDVVANNDLYVGGVIKESVRFDDNIVTTNYGPTSARQDGGYVMKRSNVNMVTDDLPKLAALAIQANYISGSFTLNIVNAATGLNYFKGWTIRYNADIISPATVLSSSNVGTTHTLTLVTAFPVALTAGTDTVDMFNKKYVGTIYEESTGINMSVGFPREEGEALIDPVNPNNGNIPDYISIAAKDVNVKGNLYLNSAMVTNTKTQITATTFLASDIMAYDIIYLKPTAITTFTLPAISSISLAANKSKAVLFVNLSAFAVTILGSSTDTFEGLASMVLTRQYSKTMLTATSEFASTWFIKG